MLYLTRKDSCWTGLIDVQGSLGEEMEAQGVTKKDPFVVTDQYLTPSDDEENTYVVQPFISMQTDTLVVKGSQFIVNGASKPTFEISPGKLKKSHTTAFPLILLYLSSGYFRSYLSVCHR
jgi:hypothetical protein